MSELKPFSPRYDSTRQVWETIWDNASVERELETMQYARTQKTVGVYTAYLPQNDIILEAGSGLSAAVIDLRRKGFNVVGLDYAVNALQISHHYDATLPLLAGDVHALPHAENSIGAYLSFGVLEHFEHGMQPALAEAYRVLKPDGILVLTIPYPNVVHQLLEWRRKIRNTSVLNDDSFYESTYTRAALCANVEKVGFKVIEAVPTSHSFTLWGLGKLFREPGYYRTSKLAELLGGILSRIFPWPFNFMTLIIAQK
jgi:SAM-dependent methyltransferase